MVGLPRAYIKKYGVTKKAWREYRKANKSRQTTSDKRGRKMARRRVRRKRRRRAKRTIPLLPLLGASVGVFAPDEGGNSVWSSLVTEHRPDLAVKRAINQYTGFWMDDGSWDISRAKGLQGIILGTAAHKVINMLGGNRAFANLPAPLNKLRL